MRTQFVICLLSALAVFAAGCYDDKGNYDYSDVNELVIDMNHAYTYSITLGETFELNPEIRFIKARAIYHVSCISGIWGKITIHRMIGTR